MKFAGPRTPPSVPANALIKRMYPEYRALMALSAHLHMRQAQSLVMTPQLMQSIQLLQMTHFELVQFIEMEVEKNPLLEMLTDEPPSPAPTQEDSVEALDSAADRASLAEGELSGDWYESDVTGHAEHLNEALDSNFDTDFTENANPNQTRLADLVSQKVGSSGASQTGEAYDFDDFSASQISLLEHVAQQIPFVARSVKDRLIAQHLADQLDDNGYIHADLDDLALRLGTTRTDVDRVLYLLQGLEPGGIFASSLSECLEIQLRQKDRLDPAMAALVKNLELLARRDFSSLRKICGVDEEDLLDMLAEIRALNPKPGAQFLPTNQETIIPDIVVRPHHNGSWQVELNPDTLPQVLVNQEYFASVSRLTAKNSPDYTFLNECMQNANWLTRSLDQRAKTILKVSIEIVRQQDAFLVHGVDQLRPLNLKTVADAIKMHESTVSRVTSNKYIMTPRGLFELKYFFTASINSAEGGDNHSAESVRHKIRALIAKETSGSILSDDDIVDHLKGSGIDIARRTVAKYREAMDIPSSVQRRREKRAMAKVVTH
jgi:RNA polymerase sigma-54 factor